jgi:hypothetical protein
MQSSTGGVTEQEVLRSKRRFVRGAVLDFLSKNGSPMLAVVPQPFSNSRPPTLAAIGFLGWWMSCDAQWLAQRRSHKAFRTHCNRSDGLVQRQFVAELGIGCGISLASSSSSIG